MSKIIRTKIKDIIYESGRTPIYEYPHSMSEEGLSLLKDKLQEEFDELLEATVSEDIVEEAADLIEIIETYTQAMGYSAEDLYKIKEGKKAKRGGFLEEFGHLLVLNSVKEKDE